MERLKKFKSKHEDYITAYLFVLPIILLMGIWFYYPVFKNFLYSFTETNLLNPDNGQFVGLQNYIDLFSDPKFINSLFISLEITVVVVPVQTILSIILAVLLNKICRFKTLLRTVYYIPYVTSIVAATAVFMNLFVQNGLLTKLFVQFGFPNVTWTADVGLALPFVMFLCIWQNVGFYMVMNLSGLQSIPSEIYDAAHVDGAGAIQEFFYVTLPMLKPTLILVILSGTMTCLQVFDQPYAISTNGGSLGFPAGATSTSSIYFYNQSFRLYHVGYGSAAAIVIFLIILVVSILQLRFMEKGEE